MDLRKFSIDASCLGNGDLQIDVTCDGHYVPHEVKSLGHRKYEICFIPRTVVTHYANIRLNGILVKGSPFPIKISQANHLFSVCGEGLGYIPVNQMTSIRIGTDSTDADHIQAHITGPNNETVPVQIHKEKADTFLVEYKPFVIGKHKIEVFYMNQPIPGNPYHSSVYDIAKAKLINLPNQLAMGSENIIKVSLKDAGDVKLSVSVIPPNKRNLQIQVDGDAVKRIKFTPTESGVHCIVMLVSGRDLPGTPLIIPCIDQNAQSSPNYSVHTPINTENRGASKVQVDGETLKVGVLGETIQTVIDSRDAGPGELIAQCNGPNKSATCEFKKQSDGRFLLYLKPQETGKHALDIKYNNEHVPRSPFVIYIMDKPVVMDKIRVFGPGITHGVLGRFESMFICDTNNAGTGDLSVRVRGPKGAFQVEMKREHHKDKCITCRYHPNESGEYQISVKWCGNDVKGSPFTVKIFNTHFELSQFIQNQKQLK